MEPFANSPFLQSVRSIVPVPVDDDEEHPRPPLRYKDLASFGLFFPEYKVKEFQIFMRFDRIVKNRHVLAFLALTDERLLRTFPFLRPFARHIVIQAKK
jgi:hypothetical protein